MYMKVINDHPIGDIIVAHDVFLREQTGTHLLRTQNVSEGNQKHFCVSDTNFMSATNVARGANRETFVSATFKSTCSLISIL